MKIALISTERLSKVESAVCAPLGIMYLAAIARNEGHEVRIANLRVHRSLKTLRNILDEVVSFGPDVVGLSSVTLYASVFELTARFFKKHTPGALLIGGGPYPTSDNQEILRKNLVDICVHGEGEVTFSNILKAIENNDSYRQINGVSYLGENDEIIENPPEKYIEDLDSLPFPAWDKIDFNSYRGYSGMADFFRWSATVQTSRGCPFNCIYCHNIFGKKFRTRSPENVLAELELLRNKYGIKSFEFIDDIFNFDRDRAIAILEGIAVRFPDISIAFPNGLRTDLLDEEVIRLLKRARCWHVSVAIETASPRMQKLIRKNLNLDKIRENIRLLRKYRIYTRGFLMIGFPGETEDEILESMRFSLAEPLNYSLIFIVSPYGKTKLHEMIGEQKRRRLAGKKDLVDYRLGIEAAGDIPYSRLEQIRSYYYRRGLVRLRNWKYWASAVVGLLRTTAITRIALLLGQTMGVRGQKINETAINIRLREYQRLKSALGIEE